MRARTTSATASRSARWYATECRVTTSGIGTTLTSPEIDYATLARGLGVHGEGPIMDPKDLRPAIARAIAIVLP